MSLIRVSISCFCSLLQSVSSLLSTCRACITALSCGSETERMSSVIFYNHNNLSDKWRETTNLSTKLPSQGTHILRTFPHHICNMHTYRLVIILAVVRWSCNINSKQTSWPVIGMKSNVPNLYGMRTGAVVSSADVALPNWNVSVSLKPSTHWQQSWIQHGRLCWKSTVAETGNK